MSAYNSTTREIPGLTIIVWPHPHDCLVLLADLSHMLDLVLAGPSLVEMIDSSRMYKLFGDEVSSEQEEVPRRLQGQVWRIMVSTMPPVSCVIYLGCLRVRCQTCVS
jgi:hypothetical protein